MSLEVVSITSASNETFRRWRALLRFNNQKKSQQTILEGKRSVIEAVIAGLSVEAIIWRRGVNVENLRNEFLTLLEHRAQAQLVDLAQLSEYILDEHLFAKLCQTNNPQDVVAVVDLPAIAQACQPDLLSERILVLENVQDPGNVGTLLRTAVAFGWQEVWLLGATASPFNPKTIRSTMGAIGFVKIVEHEDTVSALQALKSAQYIVWGADMNGRSLRHMRQNQHEKMAVVLGNEGQGLSATVKDEADALVRIEQSSRVESLNVGVAGGVFCYELATS